METNKNFDGMREAKNAFVKFSKVGDFIKGTLVDVRQMKSNLPGKEGHKTTVYEIKAQVGEFHDSKTDVDPNTGNKVVTIIEPGITVTEGEFWVVGGKDDIAPDGKQLNAGLTTNLRNVKKGQIVGFQFTEIKASKTAGFAPAKIIKVLIGGMDENYMGETSADTVSADEIPM